MKLPFIIDLKSDSPIKFGHAPEEREELKKPRSIGEMLEIISDNALYVYVDNAMHNNDHAFGFMPVQGKVKEKDGNIIFVMDAGDGHFMDIPLAPEAEHLLSADNDLLMFHVARCGDDENLVVTVVENEKEFSNPRSLNLVRSYFLEHAGIDSLHKLGKVINRSWEIHREAVENPVKYKMDPVRVNSVALEEVLPDNLLWLYTTLYAPYIDEIGAYGGGGGMTYKTFEKGLTEGNMRAYTIKAYGERVGFVITEDVGTDKGLSEPMVYIMDFAIMPQYRRKGHGRSAAKMIFDIAGNKPIFFYILRRNDPAKEFWGKMIPEAKMKMIAPEPDILRYGGDCLTYCIRKN